MSILTSEQQYAFDAIESGLSVFITGAGGTGKSFLLQHIYDTLSTNKSLKKGKTIAVTAMTGCAALLLGKHAKTLHSWGGIGLGTNTVEGLVDDIRRKKRVKVWQNIYTLVIDEVSMLTHELLEKLEGVAQILRKNSLTMGGIQMVFVGDFLQLPAILKNKNSDSNIQFVFESLIWKNTVKQNTIQLTKIHRQSDPIFQKILNEARFGNLSKESIDILNTRIGLDWKNNIIRPTLLFTKNAEVNMINEQNLAALTTEKRTFLVKTVLKNTNGYTLDSPAVKYGVEKLDKDASYMPTLILAIGAQVMLLTNMNPELGLVNGSRGVVTGFTNDVPIVQFMKGLPVQIGPYSWEIDDLKGVERVQIPLRLAYAITIHKAQGATLDSALIDIGSSTFEYGQAYVALSRVKNLESLYIWDLDEKAFRANKTVIDYYLSMNNNSNTSCNSSIKPLKQSTLSFFKKETDTDNPVNPE